jgi:hypothetical protein
VYSGTPVSGQAKRRTNRSAVTLERKTGFEPATFSFYYNRNCIARINSSLNCLKSPIEQFALDYGPIPGIGVIACDRNNLSLRQVYVVLTSTGWRAYRHMHRGPFAQIDYRM